jgi:surface antigen
MRQPFPALKKRSQVMRAFALTTFGVLCAAAGLGGCASTAAPTARPAVAAPPPAPAPGAVGGPIGQTLDEKDRAAAIAAQQEAISSGERKSWRGAQGAYGFIVPGVETGACRDYTHRIFVNGRPQESKGRACRQNGEWRVTG